MDSTSLHFTDSRERLLDSYWTRGFLAEDFLPLVRGGAVMQPRAFLFLIMLPMNARTGFEWTPNPLSRR